MSIVAMNYIHSDDFSLRCGDFTICNMAAVCHLEFLKFRVCHVTSIAMLCCSLCKISLPFIVNTCQLVVVGRVQICLKLQQFYAYPSASVSSDLKALYKSIIIIIIIIFVVIIPLSISRDFQCSLVPGCRVGL